MPVIKYPSTSPYAVTPQASWRIGLYRHRPIPPDPSDTNYPVPAKYHNRPDRLANDLYGTDDYWWVFQVRNINLIRDAFFDLKAGMTIVVPSPEHLRKVLG